MPASKIQDEQEVLRWFEEGRSYAWMVDQYRDRYGIETRESMWGNFRMRRGIPRRIARDDELIPWGVDEEHRLAYPLQMLRLEARRREGRTLSALEQQRLTGWRTKLQTEDVVVAYAPPPGRGFSYVPREPGDDDLIRRPDRKTRRRPTLE